MLSYLPTKRSSMILDGFQPLAISTGLNNLFIPPHHEQYTVLFILSIADDWFLTIANLPKKGFVVLTTVWSLEDSIFTLSVNISGSVERTRNIISTATHTDTHVHTHVCTHTHMHPHTSQAHAHTYNNYNEKIQEIYFLSRCQHLSKIIICVCMCVCVSVCVCVCVCVYTCMLCYCS